MDNLLEEFLVETLTRLQQGEGADLGHGTPATVPEKLTVATARHGEEKTTTTRSDIALPQAQRGERPHGDIQHRVEAFLVESYAQLDRLDQELVTLTEGSAESEPLSRIFRALQTLKGSCGSLGFTRLASIIHAGANVVRRLRDGELQLNVEITTALLALVDAVYQMLGNIEVMGQEGETDDTRLMATLTRFEDVSAATANGTSMGTVAVPAAPLARDGEALAIAVPSDTPPPPERPGAPRPKTAHTTRRGGGESAGNKRLGHEHPGRCGSTRRADGPGR